MTTKIILLSILVLSFIIPFGAYFLGGKKKGSFKAALGFNAVFFFGTLIIGDIMMFNGSVSAASATTTVATAADGWKYLAAALATGMSCIGAGIAVASSASAAIGALSEDSSVMGKALIFVALAESVALYGLLISFTILS
ncbi:MAG: ATP synthase subunit C [Velocimicrobium sp.]